jgi:hypothetical protein
MSSIIRATTTSGLQIAPDNSGSLQLQTNGTTTAVTIDTSQNVGIGTTSPSYKLEIGTTSDSSISANIKTSTTGTGNLFFSDTNNGQGGITYNHTSDYMRFLVNDTERMRIDSSGYMCINTTSVVDASYISLVLQSTSTNGMSVKAGTTSSYAAHQYINSSNTRVGFISFSTTATTYSTSSDYRLKDNIAPITGALDKVAQLKPVTYKWKQDNSTSEGFIAHELQEVCPQAVTGNKDAVDAEGNPVYQGIDTSFLVATLTAAIQEQQTIINDLKARIETLEAK